MILVSVIIPIYNQESYLGDCLKSLERQTLSDKEIILVNDGSTDKSKIIIDEFCQNHYDWKIIVINQPNGGLSAARNSGIRNSHGKYLFFLDADDTITDDCLMVLADFAESNNADMVMGENLKKMDDRIEYVKLGFQEELVCGNQKILDYYSERLWYNVAWNKLVKADIVKDNQFFFPEGNIFEDCLWTFKLATYIQTLGAVHKPTYSYYIRKGTQSIMQENSISSKKWIKYIPILSEMSLYIRWKCLNKSVAVNFFFMRELNFALYGLDDCGKLTRDIFNKIKNMADFNVVDIYKYRKITFKELVVYYFYNLPTFIDYPYFKFVNLYLQMKKHLR